MNNARFQRRIHLRLNLIQKIVRGITHQAKAVEGPEDSRRLMQAITHLTPVVQGPSKRSSNGEVHHYLIQHQNDERKKKLKIRFYVFLGDLWTVKHHPITRGEHNLHRIINFFFLFILFTITLHCHCPVATAPWYSCSNLSATSSS